MARCSTCGNNYERSFELTIEGKTYHFDSFECAIQKVAPTCEHCECRIMGHGVQAGERMFCCSHCAREAGVEGVATHVEDETEAPAGQRAPQASRSGERAPGGSAQAGTAQGGSAQTGAAQGGSAQAGAQPGPAGPARGLY